MQCEITEHNTSILESFLLSGFQSDLERNLYPHASKPYIQLLVLSLCPKSLKNQDKDRTYTQNVSQISQIISFYRII